MSDKYSPEQGEDHRSSNEKGNSRQMLLLILLLLVAGFGYIYYFTGLIKPRQEEAKPPAEQAVQVKKPLPPRPSEPGEKPAAAPTVQDAAKNATAVKASTPPPAAVAPPAKDEKPATPAQHPQMAEKKPGAAVPAPQPKPALQAAKPASAPVPAKPESSKKAQHEAPTAVGKEKMATAVAPKPTVKNEAKPAPVPAAAKAKTVPAKVEAKVAKPAAIKVQGKYALRVGAYVLDSEVKSTEAKLKKVGVTGIGKKKTPKVEPMNRLFLADFADHGAALAELQKLRKLTGDAFILPENGKYGVYAGSYYLGSRALSEKDRLEAKGIALTVRNVETKIQATTITAGAFAAKEDAEKMARRLKKEGVDASVIRVGKGE